MINELGLRYGHALFEIGQEQKSSERLLVELRELSSAFESNPELTNFFGSHLIPIEDRVGLLQKALQAKLSPTMFQFVNILLENNRMNLLQNIRMAFEQIMDNLHGALRGTVTSAAVIGPEERKKIEDQISKTTGKKVILTFEEDEGLVGGMVAQVGGWTFDDSLKSHLSRMSDELNRRAH